MADLGRGAGQRAAGAGRSESAAGAAEWPLRGRRLLRLEVVYARVPDSLKRVLEARAQERGLSLTAAVVELLGQGLEATDDERARELEAALAVSASKLERTRARLTEAEARHVAAGEREQITARILSALAQRARHELASCPQCRQPLRGYDLLVSGH